MEQSHVLIIQQGSNKVLDRRQFSGDGALKDGYKCFLDWADKYAALLIMEYARCEKDFEDRMVGEIFIKEN